LSLIVESRGIRAGNRKVPWLPFAAAGALVAGLLLAPGDIGAKSHAFLHGVCAQRPSHSLQLGGAHLPLDARMTGIYIAAAVTIGWVLATGRRRAARIPPRPVVLILGLFLAAMGADGSNALLVDLGAPHPYSPSNGLRLVTGTLGGMALGVAVSHLFAAVVWSERDRHVAVIDRPWELAPPLLVALSAGWPALSGLAVFYVPYSVGLVAAVVAVFWIVSIALLTIGTGRESEMRSISDLAAPASLALGLAVLVIGALSVARFAAEHFLGFPKLT
jgi:uncharacterized membrane protein